MPFQVLAGLVLWWHSDINWMKLAHLDHFPYIAWKEKRALHERKSKCPFWGCISQHEALPWANVQAAPWALQGPGHGQGCLSSILPSFLLSSATTWCPPCLPSCCTPLQQGSPRHGTAHQALGHNLHGMSETPGIFQMWYGRTRSLHGEYLAQIFSLN